MFTTHHPARRAPGVLPLLCLLATVLLLGLAHRSCSSAGPATLPPVATTVPVPPPPGGGPPAVDPMLPAVLLANCPQRVRDMVVHLRSIPGWASRSGVRGGRIFKNYERILPQTARYREYDLVPGLPRNAERIVVSLDKSNFYWTQDHYQTFTPIILP